MFSSQTLDGRSPVRERNQVPMYARYGWRTQGLEHDSVAALTPNLKSFPPDKSTIPRLTSKATPIAEGLDGRGDDW